MAPILPLTSLPATGSENHKGIEIPLETPEEWHEDIDYFFAVAKYKHGAEQGAARSTRETRAP